MKICKTKIEDIKVFFTDGSTATIPCKNIYFFSIEKNFFEYFLPLLNIKCMVTDEIYKKINKDNPKYKIVINKFYIKNNNETFDKTSTNILYKKFINDIFVNINTTDISPDLAENIANRKEQGMNDDRTELEKATNELDLFLFTPDSLNYKTFNNKVFTNVNMLSLIIGLAQITNQKHMLLSYPDNVDTYDGNILVPNNLTFLGCIKYLQSVYGLYNDSYILFSDFDKLYLITKNPKCTAMIKSEITRVYISYNDMTEYKSNQYGFNIDLKNNRYEINCISNPLIYTSNDKISELLYDDMIVSNTNTGDTKELSLTDNKVNVNRSSKILENRYDNDYIVNSSLYDLSINNYTISTTFNEIDIDILTPNKEFYIDINMQNTNYRKINGLVKLSKYLATFTKSDDELFICSVQAEFKRA